MTPLDQVFANNRRHVLGSPGRRLRAEPALRLAVVCCMDARIDLFTALGIRSGDAHILRNAGGLITEDVVRGLALSHWALGTDSILVVQHTNCGLLGLDDEALRERIRKESGGEPPARFGGFDDLEDSVRRGVEALRGNHLFRGMAVRGAIYDVDTGALSPVS